MRRPRPALDVDEAGHFTYPLDKRFSFRSYQHALSKLAFESNLLVSLPTGTGKTLVAAVVVSNFLRWFPEGIVIFMAMTRPLVQQQILACTKCVGLSPDVARLMTGVDAPSLRSKWWSAVGSSARRLIFCTPHVLINDVEKGLLDPRRIVCAVFDEAHHGASSTTKYGQVARLIREARGFCRVLALTATAGKTLPKVQGVIDTLQLARVEMRTEEALRQWLHHRELRIELIRQPTVLASRQSGGKTSRGKSGGSGGAGRASLRELLLLYGEAHLQRLRGAGALPSSTDAARLDAAQMSECKAVVDRGLANAAGLAAEGAARPLFGAASEANALALQRSQLVVASLVALADVAVGEETRPTAIKKKKAGADEGAAGEGEYEEGVESGDDEAEAPAENGALQRRRAAVEGALAAVREAGIASEHWEELRGLALAAAAGRNAGECCSLEWRRLVPKLTSLVALLQSHFTCAPASRVIAFVSRRATVSALCEQLTEAPETRELVRAVPFVGRGRRGDARGAGAAGMDQVAQQRVLQDFKGGKVNVLVATSIAEEGLDIGEVDLIICFDPVQSPIRLVQRLGRTGRAADGEAILLLTQEEKNEHTQTALRARQLVELVDEGSRLTLAPKPPPFLPAPPKCVYFESSPEEVAEVAGAATAGRITSGVATSTAAVAAGGAAKENRSPYRSSIGDLGAAADACASKKRERPAEPRGSDGGGAAVDLLQHMGSSESESSSEDDAPLVHRQRKPSASGKDGAKDQGTVRRALQPVKAKPKPTVLDMPSPTPALAPAPAPAVAGVVGSAAAVGAPQPVAAPMETLGKAEEPAAPPVPEAASTACSPARSAALQPANAACKDLSLPWRLVAPWSADTWLNEKVLQTCVTGGALPAAHCSSWAWWSDM